MTKQAARWSTDDVDHRFGDHRPPAELDELAATLDGLLDRLSAVLRNERQLSAEISHELRTPLARASAEIQLLRQRPDWTTDSTRHSTGGGQPARNGLHSGDPDDCRPASGRWFGGTLRRDSGAAETGRSTTEGCCQR